jgi:hypothetical protein
MALQQNRPYLPFIALVVRTSDSTFHHLSGGTEENHRNLMRCGFEPLLLMEYEELTSFPREGERVSAGEGIEYICGLGRHV